MTTLDRTRFTDAELDDIRQREQLSAVFDRLGLRMRRAGRMHTCLCPFHAENTPSFQVSDAKGFFHCKGCSAKGDVFDAVMMLRGCEFPEAVEYLGGTRELTEQDRAQIAQRARAQAEKAEADAKRAADSAARMWAAGQPFVRGTHGFDYLEARGVAAPHGADLRFAPALPYWGWPDPESQESVQLGTYPAMLGAIRNAAGHLIGVHRTYLDPAEPRKLTPPGCRQRNRAKKITGEQRGGSIALTPRRDRMAYGEGIETTLSWRVLAGQKAAGWGLAALVSLGNIAGGSQARKPHPFKTHSNGKPVQMSNGIPDLGHAGFVPAADVRAAILLGDSDSDPISTRASLMTGARRWRATTGCQVSVLMANDGMDFNSMLQAEAEAEAL